MEKMNSTAIAKLAGVSRSTVSRVINGYTNVPPETRAKVMRVIQENHYYPMLSGQLLAGKKTGTIGFFWVTESDIADDFLTSAFMVHVTEAAAHMGYLVLTCIVPNLTEGENVHRIRKIFMEGRIDAGIFVNVDNYEPLVEDLIADGKTVGIFDHFQNDKHERERVSVLFERETGERVIDYVTSMGHRKIGIIDGNMNRYSSFQRHEGYIRGMLRHNIPMRAEWMRYGGLTPEGSYLATKELLQGCKDDLPTVICANNDNTAFGVYKALEEAGIAIPDQISVVGIDGHPKGAYITPALSTFYFDYKSMFTSLVSRVIGIVNGDPEAQNIEIIPGQLVERDSCRRIDPNEDSPGENTPENT